MMAPLGNDRPATVHASPLLTVPDRTDETNHSNLFSRQHKPIKKSNDISPKH